MKTKEKKRKGNGRHYDSDDDLCIIVMLINSGDLEQLLIDVVILRLRQMGQISLGKYATYQ